MSLGMKRGGLISRFRKPDRSDYRLALIAAGVGLTGLVTIGSLLVAVLRAKHIAVVSADAGATVLAGLSFIYLASLLRRGKRTAWAVAIGLYVFLLARNLRHFDFDLSDNEYPLSFAILNILLPALVLAGLLRSRRFFNVKSEIRSFTTALKRSAVVLAIAFLYGMVGFQLLDEQDFRQDIPFLSGAHYTIDQFGLTTAHLLTPHTKRAKLFLDSLGTISLGSLFYVAVSLFAPIRFKLINQKADYDGVRALLRQYPSTSEDFFKLWPADKAYFFSPSRGSALAYKVTRGVALVVGDLVGLPNEFPKLLANFSDYCRLNDWEPALIHTEARHQQLYEMLGFEMQKIGEEAIVDVDDFVKKVMVDKYFRNISNRFERQKYLSEFFEPPHSQELLRRLKRISDEWLRGPGREERGFMLGYFSPAYLQQCTVAVVKDGAGAVQAFLNQLPSFSPGEANFDFLRHSQNSPGNINDFLMLNFIKYLHGQGYKKLNMGLAPLSGLDSKTDRKDSIDALLGFAYGVGSRFFSFKGLRRFKEKYQPQWQDRFIVYRGGLPGFTKALNALLRAMRPPRH